MKTRCVPVLVVLVTTVFSSSDLAGKIIVLDVPGTDETSPLDIDGSNIVGSYHDDNRTSHGLRYPGTCKKSLTRWSR